MIYKVEIKLISDCCIASGASMGTNVDTDICTNEYGFPYIPAKRLKGLIREAFRDYKTIFNTRLDEDTLFGSENDKHGSLRFSDANLNDYLELVRNNVKISRDDYSIIKDIYTSKRTQTSIDIEFETAKKGSLRTINVINKNLTFNMEIESNKDITSDLKNILKLVKHIGLNRTRGLGEVSLRVVNITKNKVQGCKEISKLDDNKVYDLKLHLVNEQAIMISSNDKTKTLNYIPGVNIYGYYATKYANGKCMDDDKLFKEMFFDGGLIFSNAYVAKNDKETIPTPLFINRLKNDKHTVSNVLSKTEVSGKKASLQNTYIEYDKFNKNEISFEELEFEFSYHHQRNIENLTSGEINEFYQYYALSANQSFVSHIIGKGLYLKKLIDSNIIYLGKSKNSQYGRTRIDSIEVSNSNEVEKSLNEFVIYFKSPTILIEENRNAISIADVLNCLEKTLNISIDKENTKNYSLGFQAVGGYNAKWNLIKQQQTAIEKGSYILLKLNEPAKIKLNGYIGIDNGIGYGSYGIIEHYSNDYICNKFEFEHSESNYVNTKFGVRYEDYKIRTKLVSEAIKNASNYVNFLNKSLIGRLNLILMSSKNYNEFKSLVSEIKNLSDDECDKDRKAKIELIITDYDECYNSLPHEKYYFDYYKTLFSLLKYRGE